jgi:hypothetical protein
MLAQMLHPDRDEEPLCAYILAEDGLAAIVNPGRDGERYLKGHRQQRLRLRWVQETHRREDFEMGGLCDAIPLPCGVVPVEFSFFTGSQYLPVTVCIRP